MESILDRIVKTKLEEVNKLPKAEVTPESMQDLAATLEPRRPFLKNLKAPSKGDIGIIAEIKKASPSKGVIQPNFNHKSIAQNYQAGHAGCLSVLTDEPWFQGKLQFLTDVRNEVQLPLLRKDFMIDPRQFPEALKAGADAILLIAAILDDSQLKNFRLLAEAAGMAALVEVHDQDELNRALDSGATFLGVNNRDLNTFQVSLDTTAKLAQSVKQELDSNELFLVAESGIHSRDDVLFLKQSGAKALLVGESLMKDQDPISKIHELIGA